MATAINQISVVGSFLFLSVMYVSVDGSCRRSFCQSTVSFLFFFFLVSVPSVCLSDRVVRHGVSVSSLRCDSFQKDYIKSFIYLFFVFLVCIFSYFITFTYLFIYLFIIRLKTEPKYYICGS